MMNNKLNTGALVLILLVACTSINQAQDFCVMTYNIRLDTPHDGVNSWPYRRTAVVSMLQEYKPSFIGTQEGFTHQLAYIDSALTRYRYIGVGRDDGKEAGEYCALFYDTTLFKVHQEQTFWLSETPDSVSYGWDSEFHRICTYGLFEHLETGKQLWVFNTHFDHVATVARKQSALLIIQTVKDCLAKKNAPVLVLGDFNATTTEEPISIILETLEDAMDKARVIEGDPKGTFTAYQDGPPTRRIDYVFIDNFDVNSYVQLETRRSDGHFLSDHLPVMACVRFKSPRPPANRSPDKQ